MVLPNVSDSPACGDEDDDSYNNCSANSGTRCYRDFVHVGRLGCHSSHLPALLIRHIFWRDRYVFERHHANDDALLCWDVLDLKFTFGRLERWALLKAFIAKQSIHNSKAQNVRRVRVPLDNDRVVLSAKHQWSRELSKSRNEG